MAAVVLHVYDVTNSPDTRVNRTIVRINNLTRDTLRIGGIFHGAIEIYGTEWSFGACPSGPGIYPSPPKSNPLYLFRESVPLGATCLSVRSVRTVLRQLAVSRKWEGREYDLLRRNCCHFCEELGQRLGVGRIPAWVNRFAVTGDTAITAAGFTIEQLRLFQETFLLGFRKLVAPSEEKTKLLLGNSLPPSSTPSPSFPTLSSSSTPFPSSSSAPPTFSSSTSSSSSASLSSSPSSPSSANSFITVRIFTKEGGEVDPSVVILGVVEGGLEITIYSDDEGEEESSEGEGESLDEEGESEEEEESDEEGEFSMEGESSEGEEDEEEESLDGEGETLVGEGEGSVEEREEEDEGEEEDEQEEEDDEEEEDDKNGCKREVEAGEEEEEGDEEVGEDGEGRDGKRLSKVNLEVPHRVARVQQESGGERHEKREGQGEGEGDKGREIDKGRGRVLYVPRSLSESYVESLKKNENIATEVKTNLEEKTKLEERRKSEGFLDFSVSPKIEGRRDAMLRNMEFKSQFLGLPEIPIEISLAEAILKIVSKGETLYGLNNLEKVENNEENYTGKCR